jgi:hypothetical protein
MNEELRVKNYGTYANREFSSFVGRFCPAGQKRPTKTESTMLPYILSLSKGRLKLLCAYVLHY